MSDAIAAYGFAVEIDHTPREKISHASAGRKVDPVGSELHSIEFDPMTLAHESARADQLEPRFRPEGPPFVDWYGNDLVGHFSRFVFALAGLSLGVTFGPFL